MNAPTHADAGAGPVGEAVALADLPRRRDLISRAEDAERERDEWKASSAMYEAAAAEGARGIEALEEIDAAWDAFGTRGNRNVLTLAEQIASLDRELDGASAGFLKLADEVYAACLPHVDPENYKGEFSPIDMIEDAFETLTLAARHVEEPGEVERLRADLADAEEVASAWKAACEKMGEAHRAVSDKAQAELAETRERLEKVEAALRFYADPKRYDGSNQSMRCFPDGDPYTNEDAPYLLDVTRDNGSIARAALTGDAQEAGR